MSSPQQPPPPDPQAAQAAVAVLVALALAQLWPSLDLMDLRRSLPAFKAAVAQEVQRHAQGSATLAARQYRQQRVAAGVGGGFTPRPADPPTLEQIAQTVDWAVEPLWSADVLTGPDTGPDAQAAASAQAGASAIADAKDRLAAASERLVGDAGAQTIVENAARDPKARGYARIPEPGCCWLCAMLASRGAAFKYDRAGRVANGRGSLAKGTVHKVGDSFAESDSRFKNGKVPSTIKVHDHCRCHPEPVFGAYEMSSRARAAEGLWIIAARGRSGQDARIAYRQAIEGRPITGTTGEITLTDAELRTVEELRRQLGGAA